MSLTGLNYFAEVIGRVQLPALRNSRIFLCSSGVRLARTRMCIIATSHWAGLSEPGDLMLWQRTQFSAQSCAPLFPGAPAATSPDCLFVAQPISQVKAAQEIMIVAPGKPIHLQILTGICFMVKSRPLLASKRHFGRGRLHFYRPPHKPVSLQCSE